MDPQEKKIEELLKKISNDEKYQGEVFEYGSIFFIIRDGEITEISNDASCSPRGGWFPDIVRGPSADVYTALNNIMEKFNIDEYFFQSAMSDIDEFSDTDITEYFKENELSDELETYEKIKDYIKNENSGFDSVYDFAKALELYGLDEGVLYYEWEGDYIEFYENVNDFGYGRGEYEDYSDEKWIDILERIDIYKV